MHHRGAGACPDQSSVRSSKRRARLDELDFVWDARIPWEIMFAELRRYKERFGDCNVAWKENPKLGTWLHRQRLRMRRGNISPERKTRLDELGFDWNPLDSVWDAMFDDLERYRNENGNCDVPVDWEPNPQLARWVITQRTRRGKLSPERKARLDALGFEWSLKKPR